MKKSRRRNPPTRNRKKSNHRKPQHYLLSFILLIGCLGIALASGGLISLNRSASAEAAPPQDTQVEISASAKQQIEALIAEKESRTPAQRKIDSQLLYAIRMGRGEPVTTNVQTLSVDVPSDSDGRIVVDITATVTDSLLNQLRVNGAEIFASVPQFRSVRAEVSLDKVEAIAALPDVRFIMPKVVATTNQATPGLSPQSDTVAPSSPTFDDRAAQVKQQLSAALSQQAGSAVPGNDIGTRNSEGDVTHKARDARNTFGFDGTGIKIGVLSDGVTTLEGAQKSGDLGPVTVLPGQAGSGDEGTAMLEIVHDLAPGAQLYFATAFTSPASFAQNILDLRAAGCDIIVDDVSYTNESPFQDGQAPNVISNTLGAVITQAVNTVTADGALYFSSAGNSGNKNDNTSGVWEGDFVDGGSLALLPGGGTVHDFDPGAGVAQSNQLTLTSALQYNLFWSDPLGASNNDYDLFVLNSASTAVVAFSTNIQNGTQDPWEFINPAAAIAAGTRFVIRKAPGAAGRFLHMTANRGRFAVNTNGVIRGHNIAADAYAVAATPAALTGGTNPNGPFPGPFTSANSQVESFSSDGPRRIFFQPDGTPYTPGNFSASGGIVRQKPDITAADGVSVTGANNFASFFYGTSAAAPHGAAIAGLLKSANPGFTPAQIRTFLTSTAIDMEVPGVDRDSGAGNIMALEAMQAALGSMPAANLETGTITATESGGNGNSFIEPGESGQLIVQLRNAGTAAATNITATLTTTTPGVSIGQDTSAYPDLPAPDGPPTTANNTTPFVFTIHGDAGCIEQIDFTLTVNYTGGPSPRVFTFNIPVGQIAVISTVLDTTAPPSGPNYVASTGTLTNRLFRGAPASSCSTNKANPGLSAATTPRYDRYQFTNTSGQSICVSVNLAYNASPFTQNQLQVVGYTPALVPANPSTNYAGDAGSSTNVQEFSFKVLPGATFDVVVNDPLPGNISSGLNQPYTLKVTGLACATAPVNQPPNTTVPGPQTTNTNTPLVFSAGNGNQIVVADPDAGNNPIALTLSISNGTLTLASTNGLSVETTEGSSPAPSLIEGTVTLIGSIPNLNNALNGMTFNPTPGFSGAASLDITTNDRGFTGSGGAKTDFDQIPINVQSGGAFQFSSATYSVTEGAAPSVTVTVTRTGGSAGAASVNFATADGTAVNGPDYTAIATTLNFADGETSKTVIIPIADDLLDEPDETVNLTLYEVTGTAVLGSPAGATLTIVDDDGPPSISINDVTVAEGNAGLSNANFNITLSQPSGRTVTVSVTTADGTASAPSDYSAVSIATLTFNPGETIKIVSVPVVGDTVAELDETFFVNLTGAVNASILDNQGLGTIADEEVLITLQFSSASYTATENSGVLTATVTRTGETGAVSVNFATSDTSGSTPCNVVTGIASERCDYATALGTLNFAAGENSKTFSVLLTNDVYVEGTESFNLTLSNPTGGAALGSQNTAVANITDNDANAPTTNPIDDAGFFVRMHYVDFLNREPDAPGLAFWTDNITKCNDPARRPAGQTVAQCIDKQRETTSAAFFLSPEFQYTGFFIYRFYKGALTGAPNYDGGSPGRFPLYEEFIRDVQQVANGIVVNNQLSAAVIEANRTAFQNQFVNRPEFKAIYDPLNNQQYVDRLFATTGVAASAADKAALVAGLNGGTETRATVLRKVVDGTVVVSESSQQFTTTYGQAFYNQEFRRAFVLMEYFGYLRRDPDGPGFNFWLGKLNQFNGDYIQAQMVRAFIVSPEYRLRFSSQP